jgi:hypothetical protein
VTLGAFRTDETPVGSAPDEPRAGGGGRTTPQDVAPPGSSFEAAPAPGSGVVPPVVGAPVGAGAPPLGQAAPASDATPPFGVAEIYLAVVLCGVVWFGATQALRVFGVRFRWTS